MSQESTRHQLGISGTHVIAGSGKSSLQDLEDTSVLSVITHFFRMYFLASFGALTTASGKTAVLSPFRQSSAQRSSSSTGCGCQQVF